MKKRSICLLLALVLCLSAISAAALAAEPEEEPIVAEPIAEEPIVIAPAPEVPAEDEEPLAEDNTMLNFCVDVKKGDYCYDSVLWAYINGISTGVDNVHFGPGSTTNREQVATILYRIVKKVNMGFTGAWVFPLNYSDTDQISDFAREAVTWCSMKGIVEGTNGAFNPKADITREQLATILYRFAKVLGESGFTGSWFFPLNYSDAASVSTWANEAMHWCVMNGIITGNADGTLNPGGSATRGQVITMLYRFCGKVEAVKPLVESN